MKLLELGGCLDYHKHILIIHLHVEKFVHILTLFIDISLSWGEVCTLLDNIE